MEYTAAPIIVTAKRITDVVNSPELFPDSNPLGVKLINPNTVPNNCPKRKYKTSAIKDKIAVTLIALLILCLHSLNYVIFFIQIISY